MKLAQQAGDFLNGVTVGAFVSGLMLCPFVLQLGWQSSIIAICVWACVMLILRRAANSFQRQFGDEILDYKLPCAVRIPPSTTIGAGCTLRSLLYALRHREGRDLWFEDSKWTGFSDMLPNGTASKRFSCEIIRTSAPTRPESGKPEDVQ